MSETTEIVRHLPDVDFTVVATVSEYLLEVNAYAILCREPLMWELSDTVTTDYTEDLAKAAVFLHGSVKWDGCSNWHFDGQDACMIHFCCVEHGQALGKLFEALYAMAAELIPTWLVQ